MHKAGVMIILYDLPMLDKEDRREYNKFRKNLKLLAYRQLQESVYIKHIRNTDLSNWEIKNINRFAPKKGSIIAFCMTQAQFQSIKILKGDYSQFNNLFSSVVYI